MVKLSKVGLGCDTHAFLASFCSLAFELYPDQDWAEVEPKLQRAWERQVAIDQCPWVDIREDARIRWEARLP